AGEVQHTEGAGPGGEGSHRGAGGEAVAVVQGVLVGAAGGAGAQARRAAVVGAALLPLRSPGPQAAAEGARALLPLGLRGEAPAAPAAEGDRLGPGDPLDGEGGALVVEAQLGRGAAGALADAGGVGGHGDLGAIDGEGGQVDLGLRALAVEARAAA